MTRVYNGFPTADFQQSTVDFSTVVATSLKKPKKIKNSKRSSTTMTAPTAETTTTPATALELTLAPEDAKLKAQLSEQGFYHVAFEDWKAQPEGTHTCYTVPRDYLTPLNGDRKRVYAVLKDHIENGRVCTGYKSDLPPWNRVNYPSVRFYLKHASAKRQRV